MKAKDVPAGSIGLLPPMADGRRVRAEVAAVAVAAAGWGMTGIMAALASAPALALAFYRMWGSLLFIAVLLLVTKRPMTRRALRLSAPGGVMLAVDLMCFLAAVQFTSVAVATVIVCLQPMLIIFASRPVLGVAVSRRSVVWSMLAVAATVVVAVGGDVHAHALAGDLLAVGSLLAWTGYFLISKQVSHSVDPIVYTAGVTLNGAFATTIVAVAAGSSLAAVELRKWVWIGLLAVVPGVGHLLLNWAHRRLDASVSSVISSAQPIVAAVAGYLVLGQRLTVIQIAAGIVSVAAIGVVVARSSSAQGLAGSEGKL